MGLGILKALHQSWSNGQPVKVQLEFQFGYIIILENWISLSVGTAYKYG